MEIRDIKTELCENSYPGRGIIIGKSADEKHAVIAYFIMGRSENSRNRVFEELDGGIRTKAFDPAKLSDPSLIIYSPVRVIQNKTIVTNGDQTDTIFEHIKNGNDFISALRTRTFEPDEPNFTPRISGVLSFENNNFTYQMSILKSTNGNANAAQRFFYEYQPVSGLAHFIHTYKNDGAPRIPSFEGEPKPVALENENIDDFISKLWNSLNNENKVSLFTRYINLENGETQTRIINKNEVK